MSSEAWWIVVGMSLWVAVFGWFAIATRPARRHERQLEHDYPHEFVAPPTPSEREQPARAATGSHAPVAGAGLTRRHEPRDPTEHVRIVKR